MITAFQYITFHFCKTHALYSYTYFKDQSYGTKKLKYDFYKFYPFHEPGYMYQGRVTLANRMNFRKNSKQPSTHPPSYLRKITLQFLDALASLGFLLETD